MFKGYPRRDLTFGDYFWMLFTSSLFVQFIAGVIGGVLVTFAYGGRLAEATLTAFVGRITIYASILSLFLSALVIYLRKIPLVNRKGLTSAQWTLIPGLSDADWKFLIKYIPASYGLYLIGATVLEKIVGPQAEAANQVVIESLFNDLPIPLMFIMIVIVAPIVEEWLFRGMILCRKGERTGSVVSIAVSSLLFCLVHMPNNIMAFYTYGAMGLMFAYAVYKTESVEAGIVYHMMNNLLGFILILILN